MSLVKVEIGNVTSVKSKEMRHVLALAEKLDVLLIGCLND